MKSIITKNTKESARRTRKKESSPCFQFVFFVFFVVQFFDLAQG